MRNQRAQSLPRHANGRCARRCATAALTASAVAMAGPGGAEAAGPKVVIDTEPAEEVAAVPEVTPIRIRNDLDDLAVRPDGTIVVATTSNSSYTNRPPRPAASVVRFGPLGVQLPSLRLIDPAARAYTTQAAVTGSGALVAWSTRGKVPVAYLSEMSDDGVATAPQRLSKPGRSGWAADAASGGGAASVLFMERRAGRRSTNTLRLAYRAPAATAFTTVTVSARRLLRDFTRYRLVIGAAGDGAIVAWSNERYASSLWRISRDGTVGPEIPVRLKGKGYVDVALAVGGDGTIGATFGVMDDPAPDQVVVAQIPPGSSTLAPLVRITSGGGSSLSTQGVGLAVSPAGRLLVSCEDRGGSQVILEGSGRAFTQTYVPYVSGGSAMAAWMPDGSAVVVVESEDPTEYPSPIRLFSIRHAPGAAFGAPRQIGPELSAGAELFSFLALAPAADGSAVLAWEAYDGRRQNLSVARITP